MKGCIHLHLLENFPSVYRTSVRLITLPFSHSPETGFARRLYSRLSRKNPTTTPISQPASASHTIEDKYALIRDSYGRLPLCMAPCS